MASRVYTHEDWRQEGNRTPLSSTVLDDPGLHSASVSRSTRVERHRSHSNNGHNHHHDVPVQHSPRSAFTPTRTPVRVNGSRSSNRSHHSHHRHHRHHHHNHHHHSHHDGDADDFRPSSVRRDPSGTSFLEQSYRSQGDVSMDGYYRRAAQRELDASVLREREARARETQARSEAAQAHTSLIESRVAEELSRENARQLARELARTRDDLNSSRVEEERLRDDMDRSLTSLETRVRHSEDTARRISETVALKSDEIETVRLHLKRALHDIRTRDDELRSKDDHIRRLEHELRLRSDDIADLKLSKQDLHNTVVERDEHISQLSATLHETEQRLTDCADELESTKLALRDANRRLEEVERDASFKHRRHENDVHALQHDLEATREAVTARDKEIAFLRGKIDDLERSLEGQRREIQMRDERLDKRHAEVQSWTSECDRLRLQLEHARQRNIDAANDHEGRLKEQKALEQELYSKISAVEVQRDVAVAAKEDLISQTARLERQIADLEGQIRSLRRALEERDQELVEANMSLPKESRRRVNTTTAATKTTQRRATGQRSSLRSKWRY
ncbi:hypothetical protein PTSG_04494 [Salpingoeca rosetta]|uniref:Myosin tail domain-containing protein n=1 Tax=Salpingoeca rosetta (strain ATCC 50818 / BSB-021) TaxID=946362 RepID=F2U8Q6_SALR5|nr:uncharacterized protein PTSG_04494 [Salpingoeca rosetta]EGD72764.1 hypothetical protein PTSG_04494 [Salpingoeca rosetta]|eukprot:XP_004994587.1 hypothetical protein PTSG_04494 [Salpingoeca rosetta]